MEIRDTLPMSAVGKILYRVLRDEHAAASAHGEPVEPELILRQAQDESSAIMTLAETRAQHERASTSSES